MEDELDQEGLEEEVTPSKGKGKGSPMKMIIIVVALLVIGSITAFGVLTVFFPDEGTEEEEPQEEIVIPREMTEYGIEFALDPSVTMSVFDERGRVRNLVLDLTFETSSSGATLLQTRIGQIREILTRTIRSFDFEQLLYQNVQDSIKTIIKNEMNVRLPLDSEEKIRSVSLNIVTQ